MENIGLLPSSHTYNGFARAVSKRHFRKGMEVVILLLFGDLYN
jgi:hypothetical protein